MGDFLMSTNMEVSSSYYHTGTPKKIQGSRSVISNCTTGYGRKSACVYAWATTTRGHGDPRAVTEHEQERRAGKDGVWALGGPYRSARLPVRGPPATRGYRQKSTVDDRLREKWGRLREKKGKRRRGKEKKRSEEENLAPILARAPSSPSPAVRQRDVAHGSPTPVVARIRARRWNISPRG
ncbi:hypothetical protein B296_00028542, partial [Ensete ventricosum]